MASGRQAQFDDRGCPDDPTLEALIAGALDPATAQLVSHHVQTCTICRALGKAIRTESKMGKLLRESAAETDVTQRDGLIARVRAALAAEKLSGPPGNEGG
ncbi:MAG: hypothetical protein CHACPFDD_01882 [Phycisphaerae bacterium]|nr:hypothetical protein [Phycisphaerae bacterium]